MKNPRMFSFLSLRLIALAVVLPAVAQAHPGHDGHELTWDLGHLAAYPGATLLWTLAFAAGIWDSRNSPAPRPRRFGSQRGVETRVGDGRLMLEC